MGGKMKPEIPMKDGAMQDAFSGWRKVLNFKPGERKRQKQRYHRIVRHKVKENYRQSIDDFDESESIT